MSPILLLNMSLAAVIVYVSSIVWILPVFRQYDTRLRYFFLVLGLADPITLFLVEILPLKAGITHSIATLLLLYTLNITYSDRAKIIFKDLLIIALFTFALFLPNLFYLTLLLHLVIFVKLLIYILKNVHQNGILDIFYSILLFYDVTVIIKIATFLSGTHQGYILTYIALAFQILIALFFIIFREDSPILKIKFNRN